MFFAPRQLQTFNINPLAQEESIPDPSVCNLRRKLIFPKQNFSILINGNLKANKPVLISVLKRSVCKEMRKFECEGKEYTYFIHFLRNKITNLRLKSDSREEGWHVPSSASITKRTLSCFSQLKQLQILEIEDKVENKILENIRKLKDLQVLKLNLSNKQLSRSQNLFKNLTNLKQLNLEMPETEIRYSARNHISSKPVQSADPIKRLSNQKFFENMSFLRSLKILNMEIFQFSTEKNPVSLNLLLSSLGKSELVEFYISLGGVNSEEVIQGADIDKFLGGVIELGVFLGQSQYDWHFPGPNLKNKKILYLSTQLRDTLHLSSLVSRCNKIQVFQFCCKGNARISTKKMLISKELQSIYLTFDPTHLKDAISDILSCLIEGLANVNSIQNLCIILSKFDDLLLKGLGKLYQLACFSNLQRLTFKIMPSSRFQISLTTSSYFDEDTLKRFGQEFGSSFSSVKELELYINFKSALHFKYIEKEIFRNKRNLIYLDLSLTWLDRLDKINLHIPFSMMPDLKDLKISTSSSSTLEATKEFAKSIQCLKKLESLKTENFLPSQGDIEWVDELAQTLGQIETLRSVKLKENKLLEKRVLSIREQLKGK